MSDTKLAFKFAEPERGTVLPIKMDRERWITIARQNNALRALNDKRPWYEFQIEDLYNELYPA